MASIDQDAFQKRDALGQPLKILPSGKDLVHWPADLDAVFQADDAAVTASTQRVGEHKAGDGSGGTDQRSGGKSHPIAVVGGGGGAVEIFFSDCAHRNSSLFSQRLFLRDW